MRIIGTILCLLMLSNTAYAISAINNAVIKEAQYYGRIKRHSQLDDFLRPWISYEEKAERLDDTAEHAYLYTPFLLIATDAREKSLKGYQVKVADSERVVQNYLGTVSFSVVLFGNQPHFGEKAKVILRQDKKKIKAYEVVIPKEAEKKIGSGKQKSFKLQCYFYFGEKQIDPNKPMILSIITGDKQQHQFYFHTKEVK